MYLSKKIIYVVCFCIILFLFNFIIGEKIAKSFGFVYCNYDLSEVESEGFKKNKNKFESTADDSKFIIDNVNTKVSNINLQIIQQNKDILQGKLYYELKFGEKSSITFDMKEGWSSFELNNSKYIKKIMWEPGLSKGQSFEVVQFEINKVQFNQIDIFAYLFLGIVLFLLIYKMSKFRVFLVFAFPLSLIYLNIYKLYGFHNGSDIFYQSLFCLIFISFFILIKCFLKEERK